MENVTGMVKGYMKQAYLTIMAELRACGYRCKGEVLNAMYFNVPQSRERVIIIGVRNDLGIEPSHPKPQTRPVTVREALAGCPDDAPAPRLSGKQAMIAAKIPQYGDGGDVTGKSWFGHKKLAWDKPSRTINKEAWQFYHPDTSQNFTIAQLKRIQSFPDS